MSPMLATQRVTTPRDIEAVAVLAHHVWNQHFLPIGVDDFAVAATGGAQSVPAITRQIREGGYEYYLIVDEDERAGYLALVADGEDGSSLQLSRLSRSRGDRRAQCSASSELLRVSEQSRPLIGRRYSASSTLGSPTRPGP